MEESSEDIDRDSDADRPIFELESENQRDTDDMLEFVASQQVTQSEEATPYDIDVQATQVPRPSLIESPTTLPFLSYLGVKLDSSVGEPQLLIE